MGRFSPQYTSAFLCPSSHVIKVGCGGGQCVEYKTSRDSSNNLKELLYNSCPIWSNYDSPEKQLLDKINFRETNGTRVSDLNLIRINIIIIPQTLETHQSFIV